MEEKRRDRRLDLDVTLELSRIDEGDGVTTIKLVHVDVLDLSRSGIGFITKQELNVGSFYDTKLQIWTKDIIEAIQWARKFNLNLKVCKMRPKNIYNAVTKAKMTGGVYTLTQVGNGIADSVINKLLNVLGL